EQDGPHFRLPTGPCRWIRSPKHNIGNLRECSRRCRRTRRRVSSKVAKAQRAGSDASTETWRLGVILLAWARSIGNPHPADLLLTSPYQQPVGDRDALVERSDRSAVFAKL